MLDPKTTALVLIDLQKGIVGMPQLGPHAASEVVTRAIGIANKFRAFRAPVVLVHVAFAKDYSDMPSRATDQPMQVPEGGLPDTWSEFVDGVEAPGDIVVLKRHWGAFTGTDLDLHLRRRGIKTIVLGGIATNFGVESTARSAWEHGYSTEIAEDLCTSVTAEAHDFAVKTIFPRISRVIQSTDIDFAMSR